MNKTEKGLEALKEEAKRCFKGDGLKSPNYEQAFLCYSEAIGINPESKLLNLLKMLFLKVPYTH